MDLGLGFNMKLLILITALFVITTQTSCIEKQNLEESSLGPPVDAASVEEAMADGVGNLDFNDVKVNEGNAATAATTFEDSQVVKVFNQTLIVDSIVDNADKMTINLNYSKQYFQNSNSSFSDVRYPIVITKDNVLSSLSNSGKVAVKSKLMSKAKAETTAEIESPFFLFSVYAYLAVSACREDQVTCHNFKFTDSESLLNSQLAHPSICPNTQKCIIPIREIEFDLIDHKIVDANGKPQRSHYTFVASKKLPFFSKVLSYCVRGLVDLGGRKVLAEDCVNVNNFTVGSAQ